MIQQMQRSRGSVIGGLLGSLLLLTACAEEEVYLPGERLPVQAVLQDPVQAAPLEGEVVPANRTAPISLGAATANASWAQSPGTAQFRTTHPALRATPQLIWSADIGGGDSRRLRITADPVVAGGRIFTLDSAAQVVATSTTGQTLWTRDLTPATDPSGQATGGGLAHAGDTLYVSVGYGILAALDAGTGAVRWTQELDASGSGTPTVVGDLVYLTAGDSEGWAVERATGRIAWRTDVAPSYANVLGAPAPAVSSDLVLFGYGSGEVVANFRQGGLQRWTTGILGKRRGRALGSIGDITSEPVIVGDSVYAGNQSGRLARLDLANGDPIWTAREGAIGPVWPVGGSVFVLTDLNELVRLDDATGTRIWGTPLPNFVKSKPRRQSEVYAHHGPILAGGRIYVASNDGLLRAFDPASGTLVSAIEVPGGATTAPVVAGGTLYLVTTKGQLLAFR
ncbi:MAG: PQQ-binding-like beta-propeller repeat protein [Sulfitobacter sp.]|nr:PQQ-binding-like beta-propeller repeat protein [Sulfitobacter sp.]